VEEAEEGEVREEEPGAGKAIETSESSTEDSESDNDSDSVSSNPDMDPLADAVSSKKPPPGFPEPGPSASAVTTTTVRASTPQPTKTMPPRQPQASDFSVLFLSLLQEVDAYQERSQQKPQGPGRPKVPPTSEFNPFKRDALLGKVYIKSLPPRQMNCLTC
jgi:hypothetical protein